MISLVPDKLYLKKHMIILSIATILIFLVAIPFCLIIIGNEDGIGVGVFALSIISSVWIVFLMLYVVFLKIWVNNLKYIIKENGIKCQKVNNSETKVSKDVIDSFKTLSVPKLNAQTITANEALTAGVKGTASGAALSLGSLGTFHPDLGLESICSIVGRF